MRAIRDAGDLAWAQAELKAARERWATCPEFYERTVRGWERHIAYCIADIQEGDGTRQPANDVSQLSTKEHDSHDIHR